MEWRCKPQYQLYRTITGKTIRRVEEQRIMEISIKQLKKFSKDFADIVKPLEEEYGVTIKLGNISYEEDRFSTKMTVTNGRDPDDVARIAFDADVWRYELLGLKPGMYNRIFTATNGRRYALHGFNTRSRKYPLIIIDIMDGTKTRASELAIDYFEEVYYVD